MMMRRAVWIAAASVFLFAAVAFGEHDISFDAARKTILVKGGTLEQPVLVAEILRASQDKGWNVVTFDENQGAYRVEASIEIGADDGTDSTLRIGSVEHPQETVVLKGNLHLKEPQKTGHPISGYTYLKTNALVIGDPANETIRPTLKFDCAKPGEFGVSIEQGATLLAYNARLGALTDDRNRWASWRGYGRNTQVIGCTLSGFQQLSSFNAVHPNVRNSIFEHMNIALYNGGQYLENCTFRHLGTAVFDGGCIYATLVNCRFENNNRNWELRFSDFGIRAIDCVFGEPRDQKVICQSHFWPQRQQRSYPSFVSERHLVFEVHDGAGKPIPGAIVTLTCEQPEAPIAVVHGRARTGADGRTPAPGKNSALWVTDAYCRATDDPNKPIENRYTYTVTVTAEGYSPVKVKGIDPDQTWVVKEITLNR